MEEVLMKMTPRARNLLSVLLCTVVLALIGFALYHFITSRLLVAMLSLTGSGFVLLIMNLAVMNMKPYVKGVLFVLLCASVVALTVIAADFFFICSALVSVCAVAGFGLLLLVMYLMKKITGTAVTRILLFVTIVLLMLDVGYVALLLALFFAHSLLYAVMLPAVGVLLLILSFLHLFRIVRNRTMKRLWITCMAIIGVTCAVYEGFRAYDRSILRVKDDGVDLHMYAPYGEGTRVAVLYEEPSLKLDSDLPRLDGATALYPVYAAFARAVYPEDSLRAESTPVSCSGTAEAYERLMRGEADVIFAALPSTEQLKKAPFQCTPIGREAFVFFVNARNPVDSLTVEQLQAIYSGEITNWKDVGGRDEEIRAFQRNANSGSQTAFVKFMDGREMMVPPEEDIEYDMGGMVSRTADYINYGNSIGYSFRFYINEMVSNRDVKILKVNGVYPNVETVGTGKYPLSAPFFAVTLKGSVKPGVVKLLDWIVSEQGQQLVSSTGYCRAAVQHP